MAGLFIDVEVAADAAADAAIVAKLVEVCPVDIFVSGDSGKLEIDQANLDVVRTLVDQAIELGRLRSENRMLQKELVGRFGFDNIVGRSRAMQKVFDMIEKGAEIAGFRQAIAYGVEQGAMLDATATEVLRKFHEIRDKEGLSAAIRWRESQFED